MTLCPMLVCLVEGRSCAGQPCRQCTAPLHSEGQGWKASTDRHHHSQDEGPTAVSNYRPSSLIYVFHYVMLKFVCVARFQVVTLNNASE